MGAIVQAAQKVVDWAWRAEPADGKMGANAVAPYVGPPHHGASTGRRLSGWLPEGTDGTSQTIRSGDMLRRRCRDLVLNTNWARAAQREFQIGMVGTGIKPWWPELEQSVRIELNKAWNNWTKECDPSGQMNFYGLQSLAANAWFSDGECFVRFRNRRPGSMEAVPLQLQMLEADLLDYSKNEDLGRRKRIKAGIEVDYEGRRYAYHFFDYHPGDVTGGFWLTANYVRVPSKDVIHFYEPVRSTDMRGIPVLSYAMIALQDLDVYVKNEGVRKAIAASLTGIVEQDWQLAPNTPAVDQSGMVEPHVSNEGIDPGTMTTLRPGEKMTFPELPDSGDFEPYVRTQLRSASAALAGTYEGLTGDMSQVNFSSIRAGMIRYAKQLAALQQNIFVHQFCQPVMKRWLDMAFVSGLVEMPGYAENPEMYQTVRWIPAGFDYVDPEKQAKAADLMIKSGISSRTEIILERGGDPDQVDLAQQKDNERAAELGLRYETDTSVAAIEEEREMEREKLEVKKEEKEEEEEEEEGGDDGGENGGDDEAAVVDFAAARAISTRQRPPSKRRVA